LQNIKAVTTKNKAKTAQRLYNQQQHCLISVVQRMKANHNVVAIILLISFVVVNISSSKNESKSQQAGSLIYPT